MSAFKGLFELQTPHDLLEKLRHDLERLRDSPIDQYAAFDFFVTAEHLIDWLLPGDGKRAAREAQRNSDSLLQVVSHIANGSKHFEATAKHHQSVQDTETTNGVFQAGTFQSDAFDVPRLIIHLHGQAAADLGSQIEVIALAEKVLQFWENHSQLK